MTRRRKRSKEPKPIKVPDKLPTRSAKKMSSVRSYVLYGRSNTGKTTLAATFPKPALLLDCRDRGTDSIADVDDIEVMDVKTWDDFEVAYWYIKKHPKRYKTLIIDTMSQLQQIVVEKVAQENHKDAARAGDWGTMSKRDWGEVAQHMKSWIINVRDLPMNVVFIAQDRVFNVDEEDEETMLDPEVGPGLSPAIAKTLNAAVSIIGNTYIRQRTRKKKVKGKTKSVKRTEYCLRIGPNPVYITKVRKPRSITPPSILVDPKYEDIINLLKGN